MHTTLVRALSLALVPLVALAAWALPAAATSSAAATTTVHVVAAPNHNEFSYKLSTKTVAPGTVTFSMTNTGTLPHDVRICTKPLTTSQVSHLPNSCATGVSSATISPGSKATTVKATFKKAGFYEYLCTLPGHAAGGMKGAFKVT